MVSLKNFENYPALLIVFICNHCPYVIHIRDSFLGFSNEYQSKGLGIIAISSNDILGFYMNIDDGTLIVHRNGSDFMGSGASSGLDFSSTSFSNDTGFFHVHYNTNANSAHSEDFNFGGAVSFSVSSANADSNGHGKF